MVPDFASKPLVFSSFWRRLFYGQFSHWGLWHPHFCLRFFDAFSVSTLGEPLVLDLFFSPDCPRVYLNMGYIGISVKWQFSWGERQGRGPQIKCNTAIFRGIVMIKHFGFRVTIFSNTLILLFFTILRKW